MAYASGSGLIIWAGLIIFWAICTAIGKRGFQPLRDMQNFFRAWRASWITFQKARIAFVEEWRNQWDESWRRAGL